MSRGKQIRITAIIGTLGVITGAFGAHFLKSRLAEPQIDSWKTAVLYLFLHVAVMLILCLSNLNDGNRKTAYTSWKLFLGGIILFSGSIFLLSLKAQLPFAVSWLGPITPIGGVLFILGWANMARMSF